MKSHVRFMNMRILVNHYRWKTFRIFWNKVLKNDIIKLKFSFWLQNRHLIKGEKHFHFVSNLLKNISWNQQRFFRKKSRRESSLILSTSHDFTKYLQKFRFHTLGFCTNIIPFAKCLSSRYVFINFEFGAQKM